MAIEIAGLAWLAPQTTRIVPKPGEGFEQALTDAARLAPLSAEEREEGTQRLFDPGPEVRFTTDELDRIRDEALASVQSLVASRLSDAGVRMSEPFELGIDAEGRVHVRGDHPDQETIERVFADDVFLRHELGRGLSISRANDLAEEIKEFQRIYALSPADAMLGYPHLFEEALPDTYFRVGEPASEE